MHSGKKYGPEYVLNLWKGARQHSRDGFEFYVFTDNIKQHPQDLGWKFIKLPTWSVNGLKPWWYKMEIFSHVYQLEGNNLYVDLDVVIVNNIDCFWNYNPDQFRICHDFNRAFSKNISFSNSSIMAWKSNSMVWLYNKFVEDIQYNIHKYRGDQDFIHDQIEKKYVWWPREWAMSWKWEIKHGGQKVPHGAYSSNEPYIIPSETKIIVCHGSPDPHEIDELKLFWDK